MTTGETNSRTEDIRSHPLQSAAQSWKAKHVMPRSHLPRSELPPLQTTAQHNSQRVSGLIWTRSLGCQELKRSSQIEHNWAGRGSFAGCVMRSLTQQATKDCLPKSNQEQRKVPRDSSDCSAMTESSARPRTPRACCRSATACTA